MVGVRDGVHVPFSDTRRRMLRSKKQEIVFAMEVTLFTHFHADILSLYTEYHRWKRSICIEPSANHFIIWQKMRSYLHWVPTMPKLHVIYFAASFDIGSVLFINLLTQQKPCYFTPNPHPLIHCF